MSSWLLLFVLLAMVEAKGLKTIGSNARDQETRQLVSYTLEPTGAECFFDESLSDCAVCASGGCQCGPENRNLCVQCGLEPECIHLVAVDDNISDTNKLTKYPTVLPNDISKMGDTTSAGFASSPIILGMFGYVAFVYFFDAF